VAVVGGYVSGLFTSNVKKAFTAGCRALVCDPQVRLTCGCGTYQPQADASGQDATTL
jgi:hypothetical protein